ncbi:germin [Malaciobacter halophilus]|uniref:Germin n=1 Tax=Malaciobacter halophilus TaxID=197482 RepID=A0A2N1J1S2_9BACT|nr:cupin domain-containing protein [Malaciobacter halophilus]AXH10814.1 Cupin domain-containing protein [Malaciobacter halophilus]PKI80498.1 germin [Malaciobacter halophilus]
MKIIKNGTQPYIKEQLKDYFTGDVGLDMLFEADEPSNVSFGHVNFMPESRTKWHTHPRGQILIVTSGQGYIQIEGEDKEYIKCGDIVWIDANEKHWHGATKTTKMSHIAIQENKNGNNVTWLEEVSNQEYLL